MDTTDSAEKREAGHTMDEWLVIEFGDDLVIQTERGQRICHIEPLAEDEANARLIAVAPNLLAIAREADKVLANLESGCAYLVLPMIKPLREIIHATIAKANAVEIVQTPNVE